MEAAYPYRVTRSKTISVTMRPQPTAGRRLWPSYPDNAVKTGHLGYVRAPERNAQCISRSSDLKATPSRVGSSVAVRS